ncbi:MAG TPA: class I SAM-dependent methyltransferase [Vicinamibacterales bacterium]|nr:class I SAM-dependent methyltransferase [Vicinamibacterales bacterium]
MPDLRDAIRRGDYARKQMFSRDRLVAWSHGRRFETALSLAKAFRGRRLLDFGSGDGTFLAMLMMTPDAPAIGVGAELSQAVVEDSRHRYENEPRLQFVLADELATPDHARQYDAVFCMEVLEHVVDWEPELARMASLLAPGGKLIVSVPVEIGLPVVVKQIARQVAGWRKIGHYPGTTSYTWGELMSAVFAGNRQHVTRPVFNTGGGGTAYDHKGFNWKVLRDRVGRQFVIEQIIASPLRLLGPQLATQVWFVAHLRAHSSGETSARS